MIRVKYTRPQVEEENGEKHTVVEFTNGSRACSCGHERGVTPNLRRDADLDLFMSQVDAALHAGKTRCPECGSDGLATVWEVSARPHGSFTLDNSASGIRFSQPRDVPVIYCPWCGLRSEGIMR